jgi:hypothetical protein
MNIRLSSIAACAAVMLLGTGAVNATTGCAELMKVRLPDTSATISKAGQVPSAPLPTAPGAPPP